MAYQYCPKHNQLTGWGCSKCRGKEMTEIMDRAMADVMKKIEDVFQAKRKPRKQNKS